MIQLSNIAPDWESLVAQLQAEAANFPTWTDRITGSTGQTLVEMIAAIGAYSQFAIESSYQETFPDSAKNAESLYAAANYAGVRIARKNPATIMVPMTAPTNMTIPAYTQFVGAGTKWFNRTAISVTSTPTTVTLYQGEVLVKSTYGLGTDFQAFISTEKDFSVSDVDVQIKINTVSIPTITQGLWTKKGQPGAQQLTRPDGSMLILFGNTLFGSKPGPNDLVTFTYVVTAGADGNNIITGGRPITMDGNPLVTGTPSINAASGGGNQPDHIIYKNVTPALFGAFDSAVTGAQYKSLPLQYPGVIDALVLSQREINPYALSYMNVMKVSLLTSSPWSSTQWDDFVTFFNAGSMYSSRFVRADPTAVNVGINAIVSCKTFSNLPNVQAKIEAALDKLFELRQGSLGLDIYQSDVITAIKEADSNVEFVQLTSPTADIILSNLNVDKPILTEVLGGGTLPVGTYDYAVSVTSTLGGSSAPAKWASITTTTPGSRVRIQWAPTLSAASYKIWGRVTGPGLGLIATVAASPQNYLDTGTVTPIAPVPSESTLATYYPRLISKTITMQYTNRNLRS